MQWAEVTRWMQSVLGAGPWADVTRTGVPRRRPPVNLPLARLSVVAMLLVAMCWCRGSAGMRFCAAATSDTIDSTDQKTWAAEARQRRLDGNRLT